MINLENLSIAEANNLKVNLEEYVDCLTKYLKKETTKKKRESFKLIDNQPEYFDIFNRAIRNDIDCMIYTPERLIGKTMLCIYMAHSYDVPLITNFHARYGEISKKANDWGFCDIEVKYVDVDKNTTVDKNPIQNYLQRDKTYIVDMGRPGHEYIEKLKSYGCQLIGFINA